MAKTIQENLVNAFDDLSASGKFFTIVFEKKDGTVRTLNGRRGVTSYLKGTGGSRKLPKNLRTVWDRPVLNYRSFDINRLIEVRAHGKIYRDDGTVTSRM
jgi:hypothetical protein